MFSQPDYQEFRSRLVDADKVSLAGCIEFDCFNALALSMSMKDEPFFFLLESANSDKTFSRYSFCGYETEKRYRCRGGKLHCNEQLLDAQANPYQLLFEVFAQQRQHDNPLFDGFQGGLVGYLAYDSVNFMGHLRQNVSSAADADSFAFVEVRKFFAYDNALQRCYAVVVRDASEAAEDCYAQGIKELSCMVEDLYQRLQKLLKHPLYLKGILGEESQTVRSREPERDMSNEEHASLIGKLQAELAAGEAIQANFSVRFSYPLSDSFRFYRYLRRLNPSPYMFYLRWQDRVLTGASPEIHLRVNGRQATIKPLAGTRPRDSRTIEEISRELLADEKERAEHLMLIDLARNDLYSSCEAESVVVIKPYTPEVYSHVIHITSEVQGRMKEGIAPWQLLAHTFPAGTLTGAPRVRAIELLEEYEKSPRGFYGGCVGYINYSGDINTAITIRSAFFDHDKVYFRAGGGIVIDSKSDYETREVERKAAVVKQTLEKCLSHTEQES